MGGINGQMIYGIVSQKTHLYTDPNCYSLTITYSLPHSRESETVKAIGEKTSSGLKRAGTAIKGTGTAIKESETVKNVGSKISSAATSLKVREI